MDHIDDEIPGAEGAAPADGKPIAYWLRAVDALISREFATALADEGVSRRDWMLLNAVDRSVDVPGLAERLARKGKRLAGLERRGWVDEAGDGTWSLTDEGRSAKERLAAKVAGIRERVAGAVSPEDFATTTATLEAIARELGWSEDEPVLGRRGFGRGFGPGRGFGAGFRPDFGPGFRPGFGPGPWHDDERGRAHGHGFAPWHEGGHGHPHHPHHGDCPGSEHGRGHRRGHSHDRHEQRHGHEHGSEQAYERGFDAGYARGAAERD